MSEEAGEAQEKSIEASARRLEQARERGDLPQTQEAQAAAAYVGLAAALWLGGAAGAEALGQALLPFIARPDELARAVFGGADGSMGASGGGGDALFLETATATLSAAAAPLLLPGALVLAFLVARRGIVLAPSKLAPKLSRISPVDNAVQKFGPRGLFEFAKSTVKLLLLLGVLLWVAWIETERLAGYARIEARLMGGLFEAMLWSILAGVLLVTPAVGIADGLWQHAEYLRRNRMSHEETKRENRETEGDPYLRARRNERGRAIARTRMLEDVPKARVVITNPEHVAVALAWDRTSGRAPVCLAKGTGEIAARIRERAAAAGVPLHRDPPTARALHATTAIGAEISPEHYRAVAAAILFADEMRAKRRPADRPLSTPGS